MAFSPSEYASWLLGSGLAVLLCTLVLRHRVMSQVPFFSLYLFLVTARTLSLWWIYHDPAIEAGIVFNTYWVLQFVQVVARGLVVGEVCWLVLGPHRGIWALTWRLLAGLAAVLAAFAGVAAAQEPLWMDGVVLRAERGLELVVVSVLVALAAVCRYYGIRVEGWVKLLAFGLALQASVHVVNNSLMFFRFESFFPWWNAIRSFSSDAAMLLWCVALWKPEAVGRARVVLLEPQVYEAVAPELGTRLRQLNERLLEMLK